jgi:hypothetical protein
MASGGTCTAPASSDSVLDAASVEDFTVTTTALSTVAVAAEVVRQAGWLSEAR